MTDVIGAVVAVVVLVGFFTGLSIFAMAAFLVETEQTNTRGKELIIKAMVEIGKSLQNIPSFPRF